MALYLAALALGAVAGLALPQRAGAFEAAVTPVLVALLYATFLGVPMARLRAAFTDGRFMAAILAVNFLIAPLVVLVLSRPLADAPALLVGVLLVLLAPCVDYVMVFTRLAGGAWSRTLAASPALMLLQIIVLPLGLTALAGSATISWRPFAGAFVLMILTPLGLSALIMPAVGEGVGRLLGQDAPSRLALAFSGTTRNSLVVLPLALALPRGLEPAAIVVVTQTLVELVVMVAYTPMLPRLIR